LEDPRIAELEEVAARAAEAIAGEEPLDPAVAMFLLRLYLDADRPALREPVGLALARALDAAGSETAVIARAAWLTLLAEATAVADDERIRPAVLELIAGLRASWPGQSRIDEAAASVDACLRAVEIVDPGDLVPDAVDHLEHVVGGCYRPGEGLVRDRHGVRERCGVMDHVLAASALLTAFELTGRLPYSMLAEELIAIARPAAGAAIVIQCEAARVLCRLASLHDDEGYRGAAVIAAGADYRADASRMLAAQSAAARAGATSAAAAYGLALLDLLK
jgi:hypothetical protein